MVTGFAFLVVARAVHRRGAGPETQLARNAYVTWWCGLGAYLLLQGALTFVAASGGLTADAYRLSRLVAIPSLCAATWGLSYYLLFVYTGRARAARLLGAGYAAVAILFLYATYAMGPRALEIRRWSVGLADSDPLMQLVYLLVGAPLIASSIAYLGLLRHTSNPARRYRIVLVGSSILAYIGSGLFARLARTDALFFTSLVGMGAVAGAAALLAYYPPRSLQRRFPDTSR